MYSWYKNVQTVIEEIDFCIKNKLDEELTLKHLAGRLCYSELYFSIFIHRNEIWRQI